MEVIRSAKDLSKKTLKKAANKVFFVLNRADELGGELRDFVQSKLDTDNTEGQPWVGTVAKTMIDRVPLVVRDKLSWLRVRGSQGRNGGIVSEFDGATGSGPVPTDYTAETSPNGPVDEGSVSGQKNTSIAISDNIVAKQTGFGDSSVAAQIVGRNSCPFTGRSILILDRNSIDYDFIDMDDSEDLLLLDQLMTETNQKTVPFVYLRGQFLGGYNALAEVDNLGQLSFLVMTEQEKRDAIASNPALAKIEITPRIGQDDARETAATT